MWNSTGGSVAGERIGRVISSSARARQSMSKHSGQDSGVVEGVVRAGLGDVPVAGQGGEAEAVEVKVEQGGEFEGAQDRRDGQPVSQRRLRAARNA